MTGRFHEWKAIINTTNGLSMAMRFDQWDCLEYHIQYQWDPQTKVGHKVLGGWTEGPNGERMHDWGDTESRAPMTFHVFQCSSNKNRWIHCTECGERLLNGAPYRPVGYKRLCLACA